MEIICYSGENWWTAGNKFDGYWKWSGVVTKRFSYQDWGNHPDQQPDSHGGNREDCAALWHGDNGRWHDAPCYYKYYYVCEKYI